MCVQHPGPLKWHIQPQIHDSKIINSNTKNTSMSRAHLRILVMNILKENNSVNYTIRCILYLLFILLIFYSFSINLTLLPFNIKSLNTLCIAKSQSAVSFAQCVQKVKVLLNLFEK